MQQLGVIGLGTMGANLARNAARNGAEVVVYNRTAERTDEFMKQYQQEGKFVSTKTIPAFVQALKTPRAILLMVKAGDAVDAVTDELLPHLTKGDMLIDAGNSHFTDTERREAALAKKGMRFIGMGVSGGEEGALNGPSMMPGGDRDAVMMLMPLFNKMSADDGAEGKCVTYIGPQGAGHFVKMVHNGIEYAIMQLIAEAYDLLKTVGKKSNAELATIFGKWSTSKQLGSFLLEITAKIFTVKDAETGKDLIDLIADVAGQKGTGKWTTETAMDAGIAIPTINAAVDARMLSGAKDMREQGKELPLSIVTTGSESPSWVDDVGAALELSMFYAYVQGFTLIAQVGEDKTWHLDLPQIARIWRGGCIIRSTMLETFQAIFSGSTAAKKPVLDRLAGPAQQQWRSVVSAGALRGVPLPAMSASLAYYDAFHGRKLPTNLIQAQRDFFGAHTYQRIDKSGTFHTSWSAA